MKAKQAAKQEVWSWKSGCRHGYCPPLPNYVCENFDDSLLHELQCSGAVPFRSPNLRSTISALKIVYAKHPEAIRDKANRIALREYYLARGAEFILDCYNSVGIVSALANVVLMLENFHCSKDVQLMDLDNIVIQVFRFRESGLKNIDISNGCERSLMKFFALRIPCTCLDEKYALAKRQFPKVARCDQCGIQKERRSMFWCSKCEAFQYCSRECQVNHWPIHQPLCKALHAHYMKEKGRTENALG